MLHLLGLEGPRTKEPAKYIRYIYNRVILENATVRAAAVSSLAQFGALVEELRPRVQVLLKRALHDNDDEVRLDAFVSCCTWTFDNSRQQASEKLEVTATVNTALYRRVVNGLHPFFYKEVLLAC